MPDGAQFPSPPPPPKISVLISSYNNRRFVQKKLDEIRAQTFFIHSEFLFIETASPERERDQFEPFCREHPNARLIALEERKTLFEAWNIGWQEARAPFVCYTNMDDTMHPELLEQVAAEFDSAACDVCTVLISKQPLDERWNDWSLAKLRRQPINMRPGPFTAWRRDIDRKIGGRFDPRFIAAGDKDFWSRIAHHRLHIGLVRKILYLYSKSPQQLSKSNALTNCKAVDDALFREKPYPQQWPTDLKRRLFWTRLLFQLAPSAYILPLRS